jgi:hypothetical protein
MTSRAIRRAYAIHRYQTVVDDQIVQAAEPLTKGYDLSTTTTIRPIRPSPTTPSIDWCEQQPVGPSSS